MTVVSIQPNQSNTPSWLCVGRRAILTVRRSSSSSSLLLLFLLSGSGMGHDSYVFCGDAPTNNWFIIRHAGRAKCEVSRTKFHWSHYDTGSVRTEPVSSHPTPQPTVVPQVWFVLLLKVLLCFVLLVCGSEILLYSSSTVLYYSIWLREAISQLFSFFRHSCHSTTPD